MKYIFTFCFSFFLLSNTFAQPQTLEIVSSSGTSTAGPTVAAKTLTFLNNTNNPTGNVLATYTPTTTATFSISNQQFTSIEGNSTIPGLNFGGTTGSGNIPPVAGNFLTQGAVGSASANQFSSSALNIGSGIDLNINYAMSVMMYTDALIDSTGANLYSPSAKVYYGDITVTFNRAVSNPIFHMTGLGGNTLQVDNSTDWWYQGFAARLELANGSPYALTKLSGSTYFNVTDSSVDDLSPNKGPSTAGTTSITIGSKTATTPFTAYASSGSFMVNGTNITSVTFRMYIVGDGGAYNGTYTSSALRWSTTANTNGDRFMMGVSVPLGLTISGNIWDDTNGDAINSSENPITTGVWVNLVDPITNDVIQSIQADANGNYSFTGLPLNTNYNIILSTSNQTGNMNLTTGTIPDGYVSTGTNLSGVASTTNKTAVISVNTGTSGLTDQNFGIEQPPLSSAVSQPVPYPAGGIIPAGWLTTDVSGSDPEQGSLSGTNAAIIIDTLPVNAIMYYDGVPVNAGDTIKNFNPALVSYTNISLGSTSVVFDYSFLDAALIKSEEPAPYTVFWTTPLPVTLINFDATKNDKVSILKWATASEQNNKGFDVQRSTDGLIWITIGFVNSKSVSGNSNEKLSYSFNDNNPSTGTNYYRLQQTDFDGKHEYSPVRVLNFNNTHEILIYPNPAQKELYIQGLSGKNIISVVNVTGQAVMQIITTNNAQQAINISRLTKGVYFVTVKAENGSISKTKIIKE